LVDKLLFNFKVVGKENIQKIKSGKVTISNHIHPLDCTMNGLANFPIRTYFATLKSNVETPGTGGIVKALGGIPIPTEVEKKIHFFINLQKLLEKNKTVHFYPEAELILYSKEIREFKSGAFRLAVDSNVPVVPLVFKFVKPYGIRKIFKKKPFVELHVLPAMYPDINLDRRDAIKKLKEDCYEAMRKSITPVKKLIDTPVKKLID